MAEARSQWIMVAGPYTATTTETRRANFARLQAAAREVLRLGHVPIIGLNNGVPMYVDPAAPLHDAALETSVAATIHDYSLRLAERCDGILQLARSPGSDSEVALVAGRGGAVYRSLDELRPPR